MEQGRDESSHPGRRFRHQARRRNCEHHQADGGRVLRLAPIVGDETFMLTYVEGFSDVPLDRLLAHHRVQGKLVTITAVSAPARSVVSPSTAIGFARKRAGGEAGSMAATW